MIGCQSRGRFEPDRESNFATELVRVSGSCLSFRDLVLWRLRLKRGLPVRGYRRLRWTRVRETLGRSSFSKTVWGRRYCGDLLGWLRVVRLRAMLRTRVPKRTFLRHGPSF
ncbi:hypothetical protein BHE74_00019234 [Ensete ventricosum]|nr:hypothetical protein BHE74_00019234 [Ensete ventricosum]